MNPEPTPIRSPLDIARGYVANTQAIGEAERDPEAGLQLAIAGGAGKIQAKHAEMARTFALVAIAEELAGARDVLTEIRDLLAELTPPAMGKGTP